MKKSIAAATTLALAKTPSALATKSKSGDLAYSTAVIGAGLFGSAAARHLSNLRDGVALIGPGEPKNRQQHQGPFASHFDNSRLTRIVDPDLTWGSLAKKSVDRYREIERLSGIPFFENVGYMMVTPGGLGADWFNLPAMQGVADQLGVSIKSLTDTDLKSRFPYLQFTPNSKAIYQQQDAGYFNPRRLIDAQQRVAVQQGAQRIEEEVVGLKKKHKQFELQLASGKQLTAKRVLVATGAYANASKLLPKNLKLLVRAAMIAETEVSPKAEYAYPATLYAKTDGEADFWGLLMPPIAYPDGRTYVKTMDGYYGDRPLTSAEEMGVWSRGAGHTHHHAVLQRALREVFPTLEVRSTSFKPCLITDTASRYPYIDMLDDALGIVIGGNGKSAKSSDEIGRLAAAMIHRDEWQSSLPRARFAAQFT